MSLPLEIRFYLTNQDRLLAYNAQLDHFCMPVLRYSLVALGFIAILGPPLFLMFHVITHLGFMSIILFLVGAVLLRAWLIIPIVRRTSISKEAEQPVLKSLTIDENALIEESESSGRIVRGWDDVDEIVETEKGVIIHHRDGSAFWVPTRAFENTAGLDEFLNLAGRKDKL